MTEKQKAFAERLKRYYAHKADAEYSSVMQKAQRDDKFEKMILSMTVDRISGRSAGLEKYKYDFQYKPKEV